MFSQASCVLTLVFVCSCKAFFFEDCGSEDAVIRYENVSLSPDPVVFGDVVYVQAGMRFLQGIQGGFEKLEVSRVFNILGFPFSIRLPCPFGGECLSDLCTSLSRGMVCEWMRGSGHECGCPSVPTVIQSQDYPVHVPPLSAFISFFADGLYRLRWTQYDYDMKEVGCVIADVNFTGKQSDNYSSYRIN